MYCLQSFYVELSGTLTTEMFYGPPGYGENPETDKKEYPYILVLDEPLKAGAIELSKIQVVGITKEKHQIVHNAIDHPIKIGGTLFSWLTGHHHTRVLIEMDQLMDGD